MARSSLKYKRKSMRGGSKSKRSYKKKQSRKRHSKRQRGGDGYIMQVEAPTVGGQTARMGYSQCCPPVYANGKVAYTDAGNRMCGGGKRKSRKSKSKRKYRKSKGKKRTNRK